MFKVNLNVFLELTLNIYLLMTSLKLSFNKMSFRVNMIEKQNQIETSWPEQKKHAMAGIELLTDSTAIPHLFR